MSKLGNKGQSLAIFVIFIPVFIMIGTLVVDVCYAKYNARRLDNIAKEVLRYGLKHIEEEPWYPQIVSMELRCRKKEFLRW